MQAGSAAEYGTKIGQLLPERCLVVKKQARSRSAIGC
jgi:hypothetical protein